MLNNENNTDNRWQIEITPWGGKKRYRMNGGIKEYEMMVTVDGIEIPQSELSAYHERKKAALQKQIEANMKKLAEKRNNKTCPYMEGMNINCIRDKCAFYSDGCKQGSGSKAPRDTKDLNCPLNRLHRHCREDCALYNKGCTLIKK